MRRMVLLALGLLAVQPGCMRDIPDTDEPPDDSDALDGALEQAAAPTLTQADCPSETSRTGLQLPRGQKAESPATWDEVTSLRARAHEHPQLGAHTRGLLFSIAYYNGDDCHRLPNDARGEYVFSSSAGSYYALYFPSTGEGFNFLDDWQVPLPDGGIARYDAAMFGPADALACLSTCAHFVELEVNEGRGGIGLHFVATALEVVDDELAIDPTQVLDDLRERFKATVDSQRAELRKLYANGQREAPNIKLGPRVDGPLQLSPSWSAHDATLEVLAWTVGSATGERKTGSETVPPADCPPGSPCAYRDAGTFDLYDQLTTTHELAAFYRVDGAGVLIEERVYPARVQTSLGQQRRAR